MSTESVTAALGVAFAYLNRRERTESEVRRRLERTGAQESVILGAVEALREQGLLDDARYARLFVEDKRALEAWGNERIRRTLRERGVDRDLVERVLAEVTAGEQETELDRAVALLARRFPEPPRDRRQRDRALGVLVRKGYEPDQALEALSRYAREGAGAQTGI